jgi:hypothetical protein
LAHLGARTIHALPEMAKLLPLIGRAKASARLSGQRA